MGGLYTVSDILAAIAAGHMQSFAEGDSWAITQVVQFPRARLLEILIALGDIEQCRTLHSRILQYARDNGIGLVRNGLWLGADGFQHPLTSGWKIRTKTFLYQREL